jgi:hypothetical protein
MKDIFYPGEKVASNICPWQNFSDLDELLMFNEHVYAVAMVDYEEYEVYCICDSVDDAYLRLLEIQAKGMGPRDYSSECKTSMYNWFGIDIFFKDPEIPNVHLKDTIYNWKRGKYL